ncbi:MAG: TMEM165/GDT1 family protein [Betaproteobacteria bacterium]|nr:TMEM165/GDT1 family protein [Betaproteobacteria bacterium]
MLQFATCTPYVPRMMRASMWEAFLVSTGVVAIAPAVGAWLIGVLGPEIIRCGLGVSFLAMAAWALIPDKFDEFERKTDRNGAFLATLIALFLVEMGDKTQVATVVAETTLGMMIAKVPAVYLGEVAAAIFAALGVAALSGFGV